MWVYKLSEFDKIYFLNKNFAKTISIATISIVTISIATISIPTSYCAKKYVRNSQLLELNGKSFFYIAINNFSSVFFFRKISHFLEQTKWEEMWNFRRKPIFFVENPSSHKEWALDIEALLYIISDNCSSFDFTGYCYCYF